MRSNNHPVCYNYDIEHFWFDFVLDFIDFDLYSVLFKMLCSEMNNTVQVCAEVREAIASMRTPEEVAILMGGD